MEGENPDRQKGLYIPQLEKDSCGTGLIANLKGEKTHQLVEDALVMLQNMEHRGACGSEPNTGDGAGILLQTPHEFFVKKCQELGFNLPEFGKYGVGVIFFPKEKNLRNQCRVLLNDYIDEMGFELLGYRKIPTDNEELGESAVASEPRMEQVFLKPMEELAPKDLERKLYVLRKYATHNLHLTYPQCEGIFYISSFSYKTIIYKGQLTTFQLRPYFPDLHDISFKSAIATIHSRFSTNTVPKWKLAQPFRYIAHNGEINTIQGNINWWKSREAQLVSEIFTEDELEKLRPICGTGLSDSGNFDNVLEFLVLSGKSLPHALMMMIPEAWQHDDQMQDFKKAFYDYHENLIEPWDGPASICFTDGILVGATLDRNGLRPSRYCLTEDDVLIVASEAGALPVDPSTIISKGRLQPGKMLIADLDENRIIGDEELKNVVCQRLPFRDWLDKNKLELQDIPSYKKGTQFMSQNNLRQLQKLYGYTKEDLKFILGPMVRIGKEPIGSMGTDTPLAILSQQPQHLANYFKQLFAQVTNPPIDPIREYSVMSLFTKLGDQKNILKLDVNHAKSIHLEQPLLTIEELLKIKHLRHDDYKTGIIELVFKPDGQKGRLKAAIDHICAVAEDLIRNGANILVLSDCSVSTNLAPIPTLLATGAIHHHLIREGLRTKTSLVIEGGDIWETHHFATLIGYGADAISPYMAFFTIDDLVENNFFEEEFSKENLHQKYIKAIGKGLLKIMSKNGISTLQSYKGAQIFEALGIHSKVIDQCFSGTVSRLQGLGFDGIAREVLEKFAKAYPEKSPKNNALENGGVYAWREDGEFHLFNPQTIHLLQFATRKGDQNAFKKYAKLIDDRAEKACTLRGLLDFRKSESIAIEEVEPVEEIFKRFATGAMSFGSISHEAHSTLAIAMNRIGGKSNSGEGGEDVSRFEKKKNGDWERSAIKQVASGRFGVTSHYLTNADELQIKMAQGAKPGEGGQLPGHKVDDWIGRVRNSTPGVGLISPPPHHDIYSIEDLAQLIFDLKNANRAARINVKLVSKTGVGIIASGVAKAHADAILISGHDGGTGASPLTSVRHAGLPWELGLAESHQTLVKNKLRDRVVLQTDGQIRTGRDLAIATLLGAEEWGVATAALVVEGCIMMRKCHMNTCPVGIATQNPDLRKRFTAKPEHIINFFTFLAEDLRKYMAQLGFRTVEEMVGKVELLKTKKGISNWKYKSLDLSPILFKEPVDDSVGQFKQVEQDHGLKRILDWKLLSAIGKGLEKGKSFATTFFVKNTDRAVGTLLSNEISKRYGLQGLPEDTYSFRFRGSAGQSFGAFAVQGLSFTLEGESNDYFGKGLSGAKLIVTPDRDAPFEAGENIIIGNVAFYGATSGKAFIKGLAGERFAVRNSGVYAVVEGIGDHGCEYMTGGRIIVLGKTGKNFAAGMSGGIAYVFNDWGDFENQYNPELVDLDPLEEEDFENVRVLLREHFLYTSSKKALKILNDWEQQKHTFIKVIPRDYKRILEQKKEEVLIG
ncbi:MAG: glutamate synthase large subunit [Saprospiraceae bacterium]